MDEILKDKRFSHVSTDPRFKRISNARRKVKIDSRFQSMFKDDKFKANFSIDKRGRRVKHSTDEDLKRYYELSSDESSTSDIEDDSDNNKSGRFVRAPKSDSGDNKSENEEVPKALKKKLTDLKVDYARGEGNLLSNSSSDDDSSDESGISDAENVQHDWGELDKDAEYIKDSTNRLAACNMDWDRIRAVDLMVLFSSFLPLGGIIRSISIYPSEFGLKRMQEEERNGPLELVSQQLEDNQNEDEEGSSYHVEKLRQYQLNRLKYYYAIIECDNENTANKLYTECDGMEYESSATKVDLRYVPDDVTFDHEPKEVCDKMPDLNKYQPRYFTNTALQQAKVELTWDETNPDRREITQKLMSGNIDSITDADLHNYVASSSGDESDSVEYKNNLEHNDQVNPKSDNEIIDKYKQILEEIDKKEDAKNNKDVEMEISWGVNLKKKTDEVIKSKKEQKNNKEELTPFEKYIEKRREKTKLKKSERLKTIKQSKNDDSDDGSLSDVSDDYVIDKRKNKQKPKDKSESNEDDTQTAELELLLMDENDKKNHFSLKKIQAQESEVKRNNKRKKNKKQEELVQTVDDFQLDINDKRFSAIFDNHHFNIDPTDPHYKQTKATKSLIHEKIKRRCDNLEHSPIMSKKSLKRK